MASRSPDAAWERRVFGSLGPFPWWLVIWNGGNCVTGVLLWRFRFAR